MQECCLVDVEEKDGVLDLDQMWKDEYLKASFFIHYKSMLSTSDLIYFNTKA